MIYIYILVHHPPPTSPLNIPSLFCPGRKLNGVHQPAARTPPSSPYMRNGTKYAREMTLTNGDSSDLARQKDDLAQRLNRKIVALTNERNTINAETTGNDMLGNEITAIVAKKIRPSEASKFRSYVDDVGHITMLLLSLSGRLARTENSLYSISDASERVSSRC